MINVLFDFLPSTKKGENTQHTHFTLLLAFMRALTHMLKRYKLKMFDKSCMLKLRMYGYCQFDIITKNCKQFVPRQKQQKRMKALCISGLRAHVNKFYHLIGRFRRRFLHCNVVAFCCRAWHDIL